MDVNHVDEFDNDLARQRLQIAVFDELRQERVGFIYAVLRLVDARLQGRDARVQLALLLLKLLRPLLLLQKKVVFTKKSKLNSLKVLHLS